MHAFLNTAAKAAFSASKAILRAVDGIDDIQVTTKAKNDFVTAVDLAVENELIMTLQKAYPDHKFLCEESGSHGNANAEYQWIIDPLDGTTNFVHGYPHFCISMALQYKNRIEHALIYDPLTDSLFTASHGSGAFKNNRRIRVSQKNQLSEALLGTVLPASQINLKEPFFDVTKNVLMHARTLRIAGAAALDLAYVGAAYLDGFWSVGLKPWDVAAASLIIREAGGIVIDFDGSDNYLQSGNIIAANPKLIKQLVEQVRSLSNFL